MESPPRSTFMAPPSLSVNEALQLISSEQSFCMYEPQRPRPPYDATYGHVRDMHADPRCRQLLYIPTRGNQTSNVRHNNPPFIPGGNVDSSNRASSINSTFADDTLLFVRNIPSSMNKAELLMDYFMKFGPVYKIEVSYQGDPGTAMIAFAESDDARSAFHSTEAVFNNRFIKVYWGAIGKTVVEKKNFSRKSSPIPVKSRSSLSKKKYTKPNMETISVLQREQMIRDVKSDCQKLNDIVSNQKLLVTKMENAKSPSEKKAIKDLIKLGMLNVPKLKKSIENKQRLIQLNQRTTKVNMQPPRTRSSSISSGNSNNEFSLNITMSSDEEEEEE